MSGIPPWTKQSQHVSFPSETAEDKFPWPKRPSGNESRDSFFFRRVEPVRPAWFVQGPQSENSADGEVFCFFLNDTKKTGGKRGDL